MSSSRRSSSLVAHLAPVVALGAVTCLVTLSTAARADSGANVSAGPADPAAEARRLFEEGGKAFEADNFQRAEEAFEGSFAIRPSFDTAVNLGITEQKLNQQRRAAEHFDFAERNFPPSESKENRDRLSKLLADAKSHVVSLRVDVDVAGARITVNGVDVGTSPLAGEAFADAGHIVVRADAPGYAPDQKEIDKSAGLDEHVGLHLAAVAGHSKPLWPVFVFGGVGAVGLGMGIAGVVISATASKDADTMAADLAKKGTRCNTGCADLQAKLDDVATFRTLGIVGFSVTGAATVAAIVYAVLPASRRAETAVQVLPVVGRKNGIVVQGRF